MGDEGLFKAYDQGQGALFSAHLAEGLDPSGPAFFIDDGVEALDLRGFEGSYARRAGLAKLARVAIDGSKIRANPSRPKTPSTETMTTEAGVLRRRCRIARPVGRRSVRCEKSGSASGANQQVRDTGPLLPRIEAVKRTTERPAEAHPMSEPLLRPERTGFKSSSRGKPQARPATGTPARANLGSGA